MSEHRVPGGALIEQAGDGRWFIWQPQGAYFVQIDTEDAILISDHSVTVPTLYGPNIPANVYTALHLSANTGMELLALAGQTSYVVGTRETIFAESAETS